MNCPCLDCVDRVQACHGSCQRYEEYKEAYERIKGLIEADRKNHHDTYDVIFGDYRKNTRPR